MNLEWLNYRKAFGESTFIRRHYTATESEIPGGYGFLEPQSDDLSWRCILVVCRLEDVRIDVGNCLYGKLIQDVKEMGTAHLWAFVFQEDQVIRKFFIRRGFLEKKQVTLPNC